MKEIIQTSTEDRFMLLMMKYILKQKTIIYIHMNYIHKKMNEIYVCLHVLHTSKSYKKKLQGSILFVQSYSFIFLGMLNFITTF